jgi:hypothetical protein
MKRAVWVVAMAPLLGCGAVPQRSLTLPAPLEGMTVEEGHLCDPHGLMQAVRAKYPGVDQAVARQETDHLLYVFGCGPPPSAPPQFANPAQMPPPLAPSAADLQAPRQTTKIVAQSEDVQIEKIGNTYRVPVRLNQTMTPT